MNVLALVKGDQRYVFLYDDANRVETLRTLGRFAANPELDFTWHDAAFLSQQIRDLAYRSEKQRQARQRLQRRFSFSHNEDLL
ncbi:MAG: hypothetical protein D6753_01725 [Planctomycetota bacterium]|nr:MAG: hypothetical protein D6753_01725 [Planctomycetota bacterium]